MGLLSWLLMGLIAGAVAKLVTPQDEKGGWVSSLVVGLVGSIIGGILGRITGLTWMLGGFWLGNLIIATGGAILVLWLYHKYFKEKWNLPL